MRGRDEGLHVAAGSVWPPEAVTETFGILAVRGAGKSNTAAVMAEEMFRLKLPFVVVDPVGSWWGLRSSADGRGPGLPLPIFGGRHGDVPLERGGGEVVADLIVDQRLSCVLDLTQFESENDKKHFLLDFARRLYRRNEAPLHLFLEEADDYIPQRPMRDEAQLLRAWENIVRRGRARGLGMTLITQRSAALNKNVLTQVQTLIAMRTTGPQDRKAIEEWVKYHGQSEEIVRSLPELAAGEAWVWSPTFLKDVVHLRFRRRSTFDSGATPKLAAGRVAATLADVDLAAVRAQMAATIERAKAEDPRELRREIAALKRELAAKPAAAPAPPRVEVHEIVPEWLVRRLEEWSGAAGQLAKAAGTLMNDLGAGHRRVQGMPPVPVPRPAPRGDLLPNLAGERERQRTRPPVDDDLPLDVELGAGERRVLTAVAQCRGATRDQISIMAGYKRATRDAYIQRLSRRGFVRVEGGEVQATREGMDALGAGFQRLPTGEALVTYWLENLPAGERAVFHAVVSAPGRVISREDVTAVTGYKRATRDAYLQRLQRRKLVVAARAGEVKAASELF